MEPSSQQPEFQRSQEELAEGLPEGYPPKREHLHDVDPMPKALQDQLDGVMRGQAERITPRPARWQQAEKDAPDEG